MSPRRGGAIFNMLNDSFSPRKPGGDIELAEITASEEEDQARQEKESNTVAKASGNITRN